MTDVAELEDLYAEEGTRLWRFLLGVSGGRRELAEDALAEAFVLAIRHASRIGHPRPWIYKTALRLIRRELKREARPVPVDLPPQREEDLAGVADLFRALRALTPNQRAAVILHLEQDLPVAECARRMGMSPATVRVHVHRARSRLQKLLRVEEVENAE